MTSAVAAIRGVFFNVLGRAVDLGAAFFLTPFLIHALGPSWNGVWTILMSLVGYYALMDVGLRNAGVKYLAQHEATGDEAALRRTIGSLRCAYLAIAAAVLVAAGSVAALFPLVATIRPGDVATIRAAVLLTGLNMALTLGCQLHATILSARKRFDLLNLVGSTAALTSALGMFLVVRSGGGVVGMSCVLLVVNFSSQFAQFLLARRVVHGLPLGWSGYDRGTLIELLRFSTLDFFVTFSKNLASQAGIFIAAVVVGPAAVTIYDLANSISHRIRRMAKEVLSVAMPLASQLHAQNRREELGALLVLLCRGLTALGLLGIILCAVFGWDLVALWIGPAYAEPVYPLLCMLMAARGLGMSGAGIHHVMVGMGKMAFLSRLSAVESTLLVGLGFLLAWTHGLTGLAASVLITQIVVAGVGLTGFASSEVGLSPLRLAREATLPALAATLPALLCALLLRTLLPPADLPTLALETLASGLVGATCVFFGCLDADLRKKVWKAVVPEAVRRRLPSFTTPSFLAPAAKPSADGLAAPGPQG